MKNVCRGGLALFLCLGMAACNGKNAGNENQSGDNTTTNKQKEDSGAALGPASLAGLKMVKDNSGNARLVATFSGDVRDLDTRLADTGVTLEYIGDKYVPLAEKDNWGQSQQFSIISQHIFEYSSNPFFLTLVQDMSDNLMLYGKYASLGFIGSKLLDNNVALLEDVSYYNYTENIINGVTVENDLGEMSGQISKGAVYSFQLGGNFSCYDIDEAINYRYYELLGYLGYDTSEYTMPAHFMLTDKSDACLADVREAVQGWLDMTLGQNKISVVMTEVSALDAWQVTSVILEVNEDIKLDSSSVLDKNELADSTLDSGRYWYNALDSLTDFSMEVLRLELPANLVTDIDGHPNGQAELLLSNIYSMAEFADRAYGFRRGFRVSNVWYLWDYDDNKWQKGEKIDIEFEPWIANGEFAAIALQKSLKEQNAPIGVKYCDEDHFECNQDDFLLIALEDIKLPLEITIPTGIFIFSDSTRNDAISLKLDNVTAPEIFKTQSGSTVSLELTQYSGDRAGKLIPGDTFVVEFSESLTDYSSVCEKITGLITGGLNVGKNDVEVNCSPSSVDVELLTELTLSVNDKLSFGTLLAADIRDSIDGDDENSRIAMAADTELFINQADFLVPPENDADEQGQLVGAVEFNWGWDVFPFTDADGQPLDEEEIKALLAKITLVNGTINGGELSADWWNLENFEYDWWVLTLRIPSGVRIVPDFSKMEDNGIVPVSFVLPEGAFNPYGFSTKGQKLIIAVNVEDYIVPLEEVTVKASYENVDCDSGALQGNSRIVFNIDGNMAGVLNEYYEYGYNELGILYDELSKKLSAVKGGNNLVELSLTDYDLFPNGMLQVTYEITNTDDTAVILHEPVAIQIQIENKLVKWELPATGVVDTLTIEDSNPADGLLTKGDLIVFHSSCYSESRYDNYYENFAAVLPDMVLMGFEEYEGDVTTLYRYVGDRAVDVSQGLKIGDLELKEEKVDPVTFKYVAGSANGNQALYEAARIKGGNYLLQETENLLLSADDYSVFVPGGTAVGFDGIYTDRDFWMNWNSIFSGLLY